MTKQFPPIAKNITGIIINSLTTAGSKDAGGGAVANGGKFEVRVRFNSTNIEAFVLFSVISTSDFFPSLEVLQSSCLEVPPYFKTAS